jgi:hypothetical protein
MFDGLIIAFGYILSAAFGLTLVCGILLAVCRRWGPSKVRGSFFPIGCALPIPFVLVTLVGCVWVLQPVDQPASLRVVRAIEIPIRSDADRQDLKDIMKRHGDKTGLYFVDTSESWRNAPTGFRKTLYFALDRPTKQREEWEVEAYDDGEGTDPWIIFFYGVDPASAKASRDVLVSVLRERFSDMLEVPVMPSGALPLRQDLVRTPAGYEVRPDRAEAYGLHAAHRDSPAPPP